MNQIKGGIAAVPGILASGVRCGLKEKGLDLALIYSQIPAKTSAVFTTNQLKGAPLLFDQEQLSTSSGLTQAIIINSGNANASTGQQGLLDARRMAELTAHCLELKMGSVLVASTGIIGVKLPIKKIERGIKEAAKQLSKRGSPLAAEAIMTTDTKPKEIAVQFMLGRDRVTIGAMAKGAGMICPQMATMLAFITTDLSISQELLKEALFAAVNNSFNMMVVDGDTSPNDMVVLLANGLAKNPEIKQLNPEFETFQQALNEVCIALVKMILLDAEGASRLMNIQVVGAESELDAKRIAKAVVSSTLVKCALHGGDPNWGRIISAIGNSGCPINLEKIAIYLEDELIVEHGVGLEFDYPKVKGYLLQTEVNILINLNQANGKAIAWGCDLSPEYVKINAHYRT